MLLTYGCGHTDERMKQTMPQSNPTRFEGCNYKIAYTSVSTIGRSSELADIRDSLCSDSPLVELANVE